MSETRNDAVQIVREGRALRSLTQETPAQEERTDKAGDSWLPYLQG